MSEAVVLATRFAELSLCEMKEILGAPGKVDRLAAEVERLEGEVTFYKESSEHAADMWGKCIKRRDALRAQVAAGREAAEWLESNAHCECHGCQSDGWPHGDKLCEPCFRALACVTNCRDAGLLEDDDG